MGEFLWVRIRISLTRPIARGQVINLKGCSIWIPFQYERVSRFYFQCGVIRHGASGCYASGRRRVHGTHEEAQYGPWLRVTTNQRRPFNGHGGQRGEEVHLGFKYRRGNIGSWGGGDSWGSDGNIPRLESQSLTRANPDNHAERVSSLRRNEPLRGSGGDVTREDCNVEGAEKDLAAIHADASFCCKAKKGNLRYGKEESTRINEETKCVIDQHLFPFSAEGNSSNMREESSRINEVANGVNDTPLFPLSVGVTANEEFTKGVKR